MDSQESSNVNQTKHIKYIKQVDETSRDSQEPSTDKGCQFCRFFSCLIILYNQYEIIRGVIWVCVEIITILMAVGLYALIALPLGYFVTVLIASSPSTISHFQSHCVLSGIFIWAPNLILFLLTQFSLFYAKCDTYSTKYCFGCVCWIILVGVVFFDFLIGFPIYMDIDSATRFFEFYGCVAGVYLIFLLIEFVFIPSIPACFWAWKMSKTHSSRTPQESQESHSVEMKEIKVDKLDT